MRWSCGWDWADGLAARGLALSGFVLREFVLGGSKLGSKGLSGLDMPFGSEGKVDVSVSGEVDEEGEEERNFSYERSVEACVNKTGHTG